MAALLSEIAYIRSLEAEEWIDGPFNIVCTISMKVQWLGEKGDPWAYLHIPTLTGIYCRPEVIVYTSEFQSAEKKITLKAMLRSQSRCHNSLETFIKMFLYENSSFLIILFHSCITFDYSIGFRKPKLSNFPTNIFSYHNWELFFFFFLEKCFERLMFLKCNFVVLALPKLS